MRNITIIGAGTMGNGIAHTFAQGGFKVKLVDISLKNLENAISTINSNLDRMVAKEKITQNEKDDTLKNIHTYNSIIETVTVDNIPMRKWFLISIHFFQKILKVYKI